MKNKSALLFLFVSVNVFAQQYWLNISSPTDNKLKIAHFTDTVFGWAAGDSGTIIHTSNSGNSWVIQNSGTLETIDDIFFIDQNTGWAIANGFFYSGTIIIKTTDRGENWSFSRFYDTTLVLNKIYFLNQTTGFLTGYSGYIFKTTNSGVNWFNTHIDTAYCPVLYLFPKNDIYFLNNNTGFACGGQIDIQGMVWTTTNGGFNWYTYCVASEPLYEILALSENYIISTGGDFEYGLSTVTSSDGGLNWFYEANNIYGRGQALGMRTPAEFWVPLDYIELFAVNTDSGKPGTLWREIQTPEFGGINYTLFASPSLGFSFADSGKIYKYNSEIIGINGSETILPERIELKQNYPNPFNPETKIEYTLNYPGIVKAEIYSITGEIISVLYNSYREAGYHSMTWNGAAFPTGVYFCRITSGNSASSVKMLLLK